MTEIANSIVVLAGVLGAIYGIYTFFVRPIKWSKQKKKEIDTELDKKLEEACNRALSPIRRDLDDLSVDLQEIREINVDQNEKLEWMNYATLDLLRQEIMYLYNHHYNEKKLTVDENTQLHKLYGDYKSGGGNSFITDLVDTMSHWEIVPNSEGEHK